MTRKISALMLGVSLVLASSQAVAHGHHSHGPALTEAEQKASEGIFADQDVKDRALSDWEGIWQSVNPYLLNGDLDPVLEQKAKKAGKSVAEYYDQRLVKPELWKLGEELRELLSADINVVLAIANDSHLMADLPWIAESIQLRNIYTDPLNVLQAELLHRSRLAEEKGEKPDPRVEQALMVTIAGVAAGMRNTG